MISRLLRISVLLIGLIIPAANTFATVYTVTNTNDSGTGSLRQAITDANAANGNRVHFNISGTAPFTINLSSSLPDIVKAIAIDGNTQPVGSYTGTDPAIIVKGSRTSIDYCFSVTAGSTGSLIRGIMITDFHLGGIYVNKVNTYILGNVICNIGQIGGGTPGNGILIEKIGNCIVKSNCIGTNTLGASGMGCTGSGIYMTDGAAASCTVGCADTVGRQNIIAYNNYGIQVKDGDFNKISGNVFYSNTTKAIYLAGTGNENTSPPVISSFSSGTVSGTASAGVVEVFASSGSQQALQYLGKGTVVSGAWSVSIGTGTWTTFVATLTLSDGSTSELSDPLSTGSCSFTDGIQSQEVTLTSPANFSTIDPTTASLTYTINTLPTLNYPVTDNHYQLIVQVAPEIMNPLTGMLMPDWASSLGSTTNPATLTTGSHTVSSISSYATAGSLPKNYYWRIGIQYEWPLAGHQPVAWSQVFKFKVDPIGVAIPAIDYITDNAQHTNNINWVYGVSYLDNGLTREGIAYIDGLGKGRQVQSKMNSTNLVMAVEAAYSDEGGGTVTTLPAPLHNDEVSARFGYAYNFFDVFDGSNWSDFSTKDFDREIKGTVNTLAPPTAVPDGVTGSVSNYYSTGNPDAYVDAAKGYPYAYNVSYNSPLQRPMLSAAGVGSDFMMTSGKEYKHFYGSPSQEELDRVYGVAKAPESEKISRTITYNPDGVGSVSYTDNEGKLIATALTVCSAPSLKALDEDGMDGFTVHVNPLNTDVMDPTTLERTATSKFFIPCCSTEVTIDYGIDLASFQLNGDTPCQSCSYDIDVQIVNETTGKVEEHYTETNYSPTASTCGTDPEHKTIVSGTFNLCGPANYTIVRTIKPAAGILSAAIDAYDSYLDTHHDDLLTAFTTQYNTQTSYYLLRKQIVPVNTTTLTDPCTLQTSVFTGSTAGSNKGNLAAATFNGATGIVKSPDGNFYIADAGNHTIRKIDNSGSVTVLAGTAGSSGSTDATGASARFNSPWDVTFRPYIGIGSDTYAASIIVADKANNKIRMVNAATGATTTIATATDGISAPEGVGIDAYGVIYVASTGNDELFKIVLSSGFSVVTRIASASTFSTPTDIAAADDGTLYITEKGASIVRKIDAAGAVTTLCTLTGGHAPLPASVFVDPIGNLFVSDPANDKILKVNATSGSVQTIAGTGTSGSTDCSSTLLTAPPTATFNNPVGLYADGTSRIYIADKGNNRIRIADLGSCLVTSGDNASDYYPDEVQVNDITDGSYTKQLVMLDGDSDGDGTSDETYRLSGITLHSPTITSASSEWINFVAAYLRVYNVDLSSQVSSIEGYSINSGSELATGYPSSVAALDESNFLYPSDLRDCWLLKVTYTKPSCADACAGTSYAPSDCGVQCHEQKMALKAYMDDSYATMSTSSYPYLIAGLSGAFHLSYLVAHYYPLNTYWLSQLATPDLTKYLAYQANRQAYEVFDETQCTNLCNGTYVPDPCVSCAPVYNNCVEANVTLLLQQYQYFIDYWNDPTRNANYPLFPFAATDLIHGTGPTYPDAFFSEKLGLPLLNLLAANTTNPTYTTKSNWNLTGGGCASCQSPGSASPTCVADPPRNMSAFPSLLLPLLETMNADCQASYTACLQMSSTSTENNYLCQQNLDNCIYALGTPPAFSSPDHAAWAADSTYCVSQYTTCIANSHPTVIDTVRLNMIHAMLVGLFPLHSDSMQVATLEASIATYTASMTYSQLEQYLDDYASQEACVLSCEQALQTAFNQWIADQKANAANAVNQAFIDGCYGNAKEALDIHYQQSFYHYTLYNYNFANNLVSTIPPEGIDYIDLSAPAEYTPATTMSPRSSRVPAHRMASTYKSTSLYTITADSPDKGSTRYLYDKAGRLRFSQTEEQRTRGTNAGYTIFSYVKYDNQYRVIESGEYRDIPHNVCLWSQEDCLTGLCFCAYPNYKLENKVDVIDFPNTPSYTFEETYVIYDNPTLTVGVPSSAYKQTYLQGRVAKTYNRDATTNLISSVTHYSYDAHGRVMFVVQELPVFGSGLKKYKTVDYVYEGLTSRVNQIIYQKGNLQEEFRHKYTYDDDYRITKAEVSRDAGHTWLQIAEYDYYLHGPVKRTGLGYKIQDVDYVYNINGWLKAINNPLSDSYTNDSNESTDTSKYAPDVFSEAINYYNGDYHRGSVGLDNTALTVPQSGTFLYDNAKDLFSGNISSTVTSNAFNLTSVTADNILAQGYSYDYLNRLTDVYAETQAQSFSAFASNSGTQGTDYASHITYDANGNIKTFLRNTMTRTLPIPGSTNSMDDMTYHYAQTTTDYHMHTKNTNNRLAHVNDTGADEAGLKDIKDQGTYTPGSPSTLNYQYDSIGRITSDVGSGITTIEWTVSNKVKKITKSDGTIVSFTYNAQNQRLTKKVDPTGSNNDVTTIYTYDASGILMATYEYAYDATSASYKYKLLDDQMYGMGRVGTYTIDEFLVTSPSAPSNDAGKELFEITDHLGSVRAVVSGARIASGGNAGNATVVQMRDYHEFGQAMRGRSYANGTYRYGYQGSEKDGDVDAGMYTTEYRALDVRLGRWFTPDPITHPSWSPYVSMNDNPIGLTDIAGLKAGDPPVSGPNDGCTGDECSAADNEAGLTNGGGGEGGGANGSQGGTGDLFSNQNSAEQMEFSRVLAAAQDHFGAKSQIVGEFKTKDASSAGYISVSPKNLSIDGGGYYLDLKYENGQWSYIEATTKKVLDVGNVYSKGENKPGLPSFVTTDARQVDAQTVEVASEKLDTGPLEEAKEKGEKSEELKVTGEVVEAVDISKTLTESTFFTLQKLIYGAELVKLTAPAFLEYLPLVGTVISGAIGESDDWSKNSEMADFTISVVELGLFLFEVSNPVGWAIGIGLFIGNGVSHLLYDQSLTEHLFDPPKGQAVPITDGPGFFDPLRPWRYHY